MADQGALFDCIVSNRLGAVTSSVARLHGHCGCHPTPAGGLAGNIGATNLVVTFAGSRPSPGALLAGNYRLAPGVQVLAADYGADQRVVMSHHLAPHLRHHVHPDGGRNSRPGAGT